ncbi:hypothetical protein [Subtercola endophyticus]|uniref:hypothetical protein n=1 Tax=Subtercola endophyticus TaxID=2895559 RepID=UPI001E645DA0|nr:hypothetical protein [Subtercola endophyticus]UFS61289.1 hypothetical protein LQ955_14380 [Subtercola endophyticus]
MSDIGRSFVGCDLEWLIGQESFCSFRSIVYFGGNGVERFLPQLLAWTVGLVLVNFVVYQTKTVRRQKKEILALTATSAAAQADTEPVSDPDAHEEAVSDSLAHRHVKVESYQIDDHELIHESIGDPATRSITAGEGANR